MEKIIGTIQRLKMPLWVADNEQGELLLAEEQQQFFINETRQAYEEVVHELSPDYELKLKNCNCFEKMFL